MLASCAWCGTDAYVDEYDEANDMAVCFGPGHAEPRMFEPKAEQAAKTTKTKSLQALSEGIAASLGLYDILPPLLNQGEWADTVVVEYRYATANPTDYGWMLDRWGHISQGSRKYSTTSFIGSTLGQLSHAGLIAYKPGTGSGFFWRSQTIGYWTRLPASDEAMDLSWAAFAPTVNAHPDEWPLAPSQ